MNHNTLQQDYNFNPDLSDTITPIKVNKLVFLAGKYRAVPITIDQAIAQSAGRVKVFPNGERVFDTTFFQERVKIMFNTELKSTPKEKSFGFRGVVSRNLLEDISECGGKKNVGKKEINRFAKSAIKMKRDERFNN